jgi:catechol 2,3-dioxygenase-like lactoylglutathione lyase family enzyme
VPRIDGIYETVLYTDDIAAATAFYTDVIGLRAIDPPDEHSAAFRLEDRSLLLLFEPQRSGAPERFVPSHGTVGPGHVAFRTTELDVLANELGSQGIEIEREITWPLGGRSVYIRDPDGNSIEFVEGEIWGA